MRLAIRVERVRNRLKHELDHRIGTATRKKGRDQGKGEREGETKSKENDDVNVLGKKKVNPTGEHSRLG